MKPRLKKFLKICYINMYKNTRFSLGSLFEINESYKITLFPYFL